MDSIVKYCLWVCPRNSDIFQCLIRLTWMVFKIGGKWLYRYWCMRCCFHDLFKIARSIFFFRFLQDFCPFVSLESMQCIHWVVLRLAHLGRNAVLFCRRDQISRVNSFINISINNFLRFAIKSLIRFVFWYDHHRLGNSQHIHNL